MDNKDIFDQELERIEQSNANIQKDAFDSWSNTNPPVMQQKPKRKPWYIVLICLGLVFCIAIGWVLCALFSSKTDERKQILDLVVDTMDLNFYSEIDEKRWNEAVEMAGSVLMQTAGDRYSLLMSPQTYYDNYLSQANSSTNMTNKLVFGMSFVVDYGGLYVHEVMTDSNAYGKLKAGDVIYKITNITEYVPILDAKGKLQSDEYGNLIAEVDSNGQYVTKSSTTYPKGVSFEGTGDKSFISDYVSIVQSATFHVFRASTGTAHEYQLERRKVGQIVDITNLYQRYDMELVEYYFDSQVNNISTTNQNGAATNVYLERKLNQLPANTGYIRIKQFNSTSLGGTAYEFALALTLFKQRNLTNLVLDLKGNGGGSVDETVKIAGMLINTNNITVKDANSLTNENGELRITSFVDRDGNTENLYTKSIYNTYFKENSKITVWTDGGSASASELLTGVLLDYKMATHMGTKTFGKGIAQNGLVLTTNSGKEVTGTYVDDKGVTQTGPWIIYYTFAKYLSPMGDNIHEVGYTPQESEYNNLDSYEKLWQQTQILFG